MPLLRSIVYVSTAVQPMPEPELEALLIEARDLNRDSRVTGVLIYSGGNFMQCFEGPEDGVAQTYERIRASRRHTGLIELVSEAVPERSFKSWEMGFKRARQSELIALSSATWQRQFDADTAPATAQSSGMYLLRLFWNQA